MPTQPLLEVWPDDEPLSVVEGSLPLVVGAVTGVLVVPVVAVGPVVDPLEPVPEDELPEPL